MTVGEKIKKTRKEKKLTQAELSKIIGISVPTLQRYENGVTELKPSTINKIAEALEVDINVLLSDDEPKKVYSAADLFVGVGFNPDSSLPVIKEENESALKRIIVEQNGAIYSFSVTSDLSNEEIERTIKIAEEIIRKQKK